MRRLKIAIVLLAFAFIPRAFAQCCPNNCSLSFNPNQCEINGTNKSCGASFACPANPSPPPASGSTSSGGGWIGQLPPPPPCFLSNPTKALRDVATDACVSALSTNAKLWGCVFEDSVGKAEDQKTGLSCTARQELLANRCRKRCADLAADTRTCYDADTEWQHFFGDISGEHVGSARVDLCEGPPLRDVHITRPQRVPLRRYQ
jgi:hypothetical protein